MTLSARWSALGLGLLLLAQIAFLKPTNFAGYDEWLVLDLAEAGVLSVPHANRPLGLVWAAPALLAPSSFLAYFLLGALYLLLTAWLVTLSVRRLVPEAPLVAFLAGAFTILWAPSDPMRMAAVQMMLYHGITLGTTLALFLFLESWVRDSVPLLALAFAFMVAALRSYEAGLALVIAAPVIPALLSRRRTLRLWSFMLAWEAVALLCLGLAMLAPPEQRAYQSALSADPAPLHVAARLARLLGFHLAPLGSLVWSGASAAAVAGGLAAFLLVYLLAARGSGWWPEASARRACVGLGVAGLAAAALADLAFALTPSVGVLRTEFLSAPGIGVLLAALPAWLASFAPARLRKAALGLLAAWIAACGAARTSSLQAEWNHISVYSGEWAALRRLTAQVPDVAPHTLLVLIDEARAWPSVAGFRYAVDYLYEGRAGGHVSNANAYNVSTRFLPDGVESELAPVLRGPWHAAVQRYSYDEVVVLRLDRSGSLSVLDKWPIELPALPEGARYRPRARIRPLTAPIARRAVLDRG